MVEGMNEQMNNLKMGNGTTPISPTIASGNEPYWKLVNTHESFKVSIAHLGIIFLDNMLRHGVS